MTGCRDRPAGIKVSGTTYSRLDDQFPDLLMPLEAEGLIRSLQNCCETTEEMLQLDESQKKKARVFSRDHSPDGVSYKVFFVPS